LQALDRSPELARRLGPLRIDGGTVQRQVFVDTFADLAEALEVGAHLPPRSVAYARLIRRGDQLLDRGDAAGALEVYAEAQRVDPDNSLASIARGDLFLGQAQQDRAIAEYGKALQLDPQSALAHNNRGLAYKRKGDHERALADFTQALRIDPRLAGAFHNRGA